MPEIDRHISSWSLLCLFWNLSFWVINLRIMQVNVIVSGRLFINTGVEQRRYWTGSFKSSEWSISKCEVGCSEFVCCLVKVYETTDGQTSAGILLRPGAPELVIKILVLLLSQTFFFNMIFHLEMDLKYSSTTVVGLYGGNWQLCTPKLFFSTCSKWEEELHPCIYFTMELATALDILKSIRSFITLGKRFFFFTFIFCSSRGQYQKKNYFLK